MYFGSYEHNLDEKGRLLIPRKLKEGLSEGSLLYILKGFEGCIAVYNKAEFTKLVEECSEISFKKKNSRAYLRLMLSSVTELVIDKVGRIQLPTQVLTKYQIGRQVMIIGVGDHFEIWDLTKYNQYESEANANFEEIAEALDSDDE